MHDGNYTVSDHPIRQKDEGNGKFTYIKFDVGGASETESVRIPSNNWIGLIHLPANA